MRVALVTSEGACGIAEHSQMLCEAVHAADPTVQFVRNPAWLDPVNFVTDLANGFEYDVLHLNYHRGLHSRWTPEMLQDRRKPTVITFHDTYEVQPDRLPWELLEQCDAMIVHEPCDLLADPRVRYWRQGVPEPPARFGPDQALLSYPIVGSFGFDFPWKGFDLLCEAAESVGWGVRILSNNMQVDRIQQLKKLNRRLQATVSFLGRNQIIEELMRCDATAFLYQCANSGTSGAIRLGVAAGKRVLAAKGCRQFRDLEGQVDTGIRWVTPDVVAVAGALMRVQPQPFDPMVVALRERDSWRHLGRRYAALYRSILSQRELPQ